MKKLLVFAAMMVSLAFAKSEPFTHDGFYFSITSGLGYGSINQDVGNGLATIESKGVQAETSFKIGAAIVHGLIIHATFAMNQLYSDLVATSKYGDEESLSHDGFNIFLFGGGATFYIPGNTNIFLSASAGASDYSISLGNKSADYLNLDPGFGFTAMIGKEWWIHEELGLGIAFSYTHTSAEGTYRRQHNDASTNMFTLSASFTFN